MPCPSASAKLQLETWARNRLEPAEAAARAMHFVVRKHPFWDANHRVAYLLGLAIMACFGRFVSASPEEAWEGMTVIDREDAPVGELRKWLEARLVPLSDVLPGEPL